MTRALTIDQLDAFRLPVAAQAIAPVYICPVCGTKHPDRLAMLKCMRSTEQSLAKAGDIVVISNGYGWFDGDEAWLYSRNGYKFHDTHTLEFWYVITAVTQYDGNVNRNGEGDLALHTLVYHVRTLGLKNGDVEGHSGWTRPRGHVGWRVPEEKPPQAVADAAAALVGQTFNRLL